MSSKDDGSGDAGGGDYPQPNRSSSSNDGTGSSRTQTLTLPRDPQQDETDELVRGFMYYRMEHEQLRERGHEGVVSTPGVDAFMNFNRLSPTAHVARSLATIGEDIYERYADEFDGMMRSLSVNEHTAYSTFRDIARRLFADGIINWGRIIALLLFGYKLAVESFKRGFNEFISSIISYVAKFIILEKIYSWVADQGGWAQSQLVPGVNQDIIPRNYVALVVSLVAGVTLYRWYKGI